MQLDIFLDSTNENTEATSTPYYFKETKIEDMDDDQLVYTYWQHFLPEVKKLHKEFQTGKNEHGGYTDNGWWLSRFSDFLTHTNSAPKTHEEWLYRKTGYGIFPKIWEKYSDFLIKPFDHII